MVLEGPGIGRGGVPIINRITWSVVNRDPDHVRQLWQTSTDDGKSWSVAFDRHYHRGGRTSVVSQKFASHRECRGAGFGAPAPLGVDQARRRGVATRAPRPKAVVRGGGTPQGRMHRCSSRATFMLAVSAESTARRSSAARSMAETLLGHHTGSLLRRLALPEASAGTITAGRKWPASCTSVSATSMPAYLAAAPTR